MAQGDGCQYGRANRYAIYAVSTIVIAGAIWVINNAFALANNMTGRLTPLEQQVRASDERLQATRESLIRVETKLQVIEANQQKVLSTLDTLNRKVP